jgi:hypothetical protein
MRPPRDKRGDKSDEKSRDKTKDGEKGKTEFHQKLEALQRGSVYDGKEKYA